MIKKGKLKIVLFLFLLISMVSCFNESNKYNLKLTSIGNGVLLGDGNYSEGESISIVATPDSDWMFLHWKNEDEEIVTTQSAFDFTMPDNDIVFEAVFIKKVLKLNLMNSIERYVNAKSDSTYFAADGNDFILMSVEDSYSEVFYNFIDTQEITQILTYSSITTTKAEEYTIKALDTTHNRQSNTALAKACSKEQYLYENMKDFYYWADEVPHEFDWTNEKYKDNLQAMIMDLANENDKWSYVAPSNEDDDFMSGVSEIFGFYSSYLEEEGKLLVHFTFKNSPAAKLGLERSDKIIKIDGRSVKDIWENNNMNEALYLKTKDDEVEFTFEKTNGETISKSTSKEEITIDTIIYDEIFEIDDKKIGYFVYYLFIGSNNEDLKRVFSKFKTEEVDELIVDLRYNGGGKLSLANDLAEMIAGDNVANKILYEMSYNEKYSALNFSYDLKNREDSLNLDRVVFITTDESASASELVINGLEPYIDVVTVGQTTHGKPSGMNKVIFFDQNLWAVNFIIKNGENFGEYFDGLKPTIEAENDYTKNWGDREEDSLKKALAYLKTDKLAIKKSPKILLPELTDISQDNYQRFKKIH